MVRITFFPQYVDPGARLTQDMQSIYSQIEGSVRLKRVHVNISIDLNFDQIEWDGVDLK